ncbi:hypothetical protein [Paracoccus sp. (in: a-proteobacteria)]|uniref:hypothetical protein n=1 Tax=Paracoccus sp. TaxID=267 RepID=UPI00396C4A37
MTFRTRWTTGLVVLATMMATTAIADSGRGRQHDDRGHGRAEHCPPGLAKKSPRCAPPGQAKKDHHLRVGDRLNAGRYTGITDPGRYGLDGRAGWDYYRDGDQAYRVDRQTQRVLAVINLINAFSN